MKLLVICSALVLCGCDDNLPSTSFIDKLRVLAVQAEPPEVSPGTATTLSVFAVEPPLPHLDGGTNPPVIDAYWLACAEPPGALQSEPCGVAPDSGIPPLCSDQPGAAICIIGGGLSAKYTPNATFIGSDGTGQVLLTVVVADVVGGAVQCLMDIQQNGGLPKYPDHCVVAFKQLALNANAGATLNQNPTLSALSLTPKNGSAESLLDGSATFPVGTDKSAPTFTLSTTRSDGSSEQDSSGNYEALSISWYTTSGKISDGRSAFLPPGCPAQSSCPTKAPVDVTTTNWQVPKATQLATTADAAGTVEFWAVIRDDRGGVSVLGGTAHASPAPSQ